MPEQPTAPIREVQKSLDAQQFQYAKTRIEASRRLATDLTPSRNTPGAIALGHFTLTHPELVNDVDATAYEAQRINMVYHASEGQESVSEGLVFFLKPGEDGQPELLDVDGNPLFLNRELYDAHYLTMWTSRGTKDESIFVPSIDKNGKIASVVALRQKVNPD